MHFGRTRAQQTRFLRQFSSEGNQFIEPYGFSGSLSAVSLIMYNCSVSFTAENKLVVVV